MARIYGNAPLQRPGAPGARQPRQPQREQRPPTSPAVLVGACTLVASCGLYLACGYMALTTGGAFWVAATGGSLLFGFVAPDLIAWKAGVRLLSWP